MTAKVSQLDIRYARAEEVRAIAELWCLAFPSRRTAEERSAMLRSGGRYGGLETTLVAHMDSRLVAACKVYRLTQYIAAVGMPAMGLAAVAVLPDARRQGVGARLCTAAMSAALERGDLISTLYPFRPDYYERLGWGLVGELHEYRLRSAALPAYEQYRFVRNVRSPADAEAIAACYGRVAARSNGPIQRDARVWAYRLAGEDLGVRPVSPAVATVTPADKSRNRVVLYDRDGVTGYALLRQVTGAGPTRVSVRELIAETEDAYRGILGYLARQSEVWPLVRHAARVEERFGDRLTDPRPPGAGRARSLYFPTARIIRGPMVRILDVAGALAARRYFTTDPVGTLRRATIEVRVDDAQIPGNRGPWLLRTDAGKVRVTGTGGPGVDGNGAGADATLQTDATTLARVFAGDVPPTDVPRLGGGQVDGDLRLLDSAFATAERAWLLDEF
jgi:predicted acetyltransferase